MPEGPDVRRYLDAIKSIKGKELVDVKYLAGKYAKKPPSGWPAFAGALPLKVADLGVKGKLLWFKFNKGRAAWISFGLTGLIMKVDSGHNGTLAAIKKVAGSEIIKHFKNRGRDGVKPANVVFQFRRSALLFYDNLSYGNIGFGTHASLNQKLKTIGPDVYGMGLEQFKRIVEGMGNKMIAKALIDQKKLSGIGNFMRAEIMHAAGIDPFAAASTMSDADVRRLWRALKKVYSEAKKGDYVFKVYRRPSAKWRVVDGSKVWYKA